MFTGFKAEFIVDDSVWFFKTAYPFGISNFLEAKGNIGTVQIRDPIDIWKSTYQYSATWTQNKSLKNDLATELLEEFKAGLPLFLKQYNTSYKLWMDQLKKNNFPLVFMKYEDIVKDAKTELHQIFAFLLGVEDVSDCYVSTRIEKTLGDASSGKTYVRRNKDKEAALVT
mmetsp:Transcript_5189/g.3888  ORF Transcript_5189/g.3888 Transcript_5189/m.3888 type:complete len:170 (-) Transcript_5189:181-690(-)